MALSPHRNMELTQLTEESFLLRPASDPKVTKSEQHKITSPSNSPPSTKDSELDTIAATKLAICAELELEKVPYSITVAVYKIPDPPDPMGSPCLLPEDPDVRTVSGFLNFVSQSAAGSPFRKTDSGCCSESIYDDFRFKRVKLKRDADSKLPLNCLDEASSEDAESEYNCKNFSCQTESNHSLPELSVALPRMDYLVDFQNNIVQALQENALLRKTQIEQLNNSQVESLEHGDFVCQSGIDHDMNMPLVCCDLDLASLPCNKLSKIRK